MAIRNQFGYYPSNFDLMEFCAKNKLPINKVVKVLNLFIRKPLSQADKRSIKLNSEILKNSVGDIYKRIIDCLIVNGVIENTAGYEIGVKSREYQLTDEYYFSDEVKKHILEDKPINQVLDYRNKERMFTQYVEDLNKPKVKRTVRPPIQIFEERYKNLIIWFRDGKITIDSAKAFSLIRQQNIKEIQPHKYLSYLATIDIFKENDYHLKSDLNHRLYSSLTNLPKFLRGCLMYNGEELVGVDVSNTQPLLLSLICEFDYLEELYLSQNIDVSPKKLVKFLRHLKTNPADLDKFKRLVQKGIFYESFMDIGPTFSRDVVKENIVKIINDKGLNRTKEKKIIRETLKARFPTISMLLDVLKSIDHRYASWTLMTKEAEMFLFHFIDTFYQNPAHKLIPIFTIHDCFITTCSNVNLLEIEIKKFFQENYEINIPLKREIYV
ncbi:hypothetical protein VR611_13400, partial [Aquirufa nivalisilvae]